MRGKLIPSHGGDAQCRITPADAGKTPSCTTFAPLVQDHPRGCGENDTEQSISEMNEGSPPRMRGKLLSPFALKLRERITPADAGKTPTLCLQPMYAVGSPPRMRGKQLLSVLWCLVIRITPADAGKTR